MYLTFKKSICQPIIVNGESISAWKKQAFNDYRELVSILFFFKRLQLYCFFRLKEIRLRLRKKRKSNDHNYRIYGV